MLKLVTMLENRVLERSGAGFCSKGSLTISNSEILQLIELHTVKLGEAAHKTSTWYTVTPNLRMW